MAVPAAAVAAARVALVPREPAVPVRARLARAHSVLLLLERPVPVNLLPAVAVQALLVQALLVQVDLAVPRRRREPAAPRLAEPQVVVERVQVVGPAAAVARRLSRQSSSAAMARSSN